MSPDLHLQQDKARFEQLLPFYVTHQLAEVDQRFMQQYIAQHPEAHKALKFTERLRRIVRATGAHRNPDQALERLLGNFQQGTRLSLRQRILTKLRALGISPTLAIAMLVLLGQGMGYGAYKLGLFSKTTATLSAPVKGDLSITLKRGSEMAAVTGILDRFGAQIVHSDLAIQGGKLLVTIADKARIQSLIDALMEIGLVESVAVLF